MPYLLIALAAVLFLPRKAGFAVKNNFWSDLSKRVTLYDANFKYYAEAYGLDWKMLKAIAMIESWLGTYTGVIDTPSERASASNAPDSSDKLSAGIMQVTLTTARDYYPRTEWRDLQNPEFSIKLAAQHLEMLKRLSRAYPSRAVEYMVKSYNQGQGNTNKEFSGKIKEGYANNYWLKYLDAYNNIQ
jgi:membrane-bound lytic murein transglycosylase MltF